MNSIKIKLAAAIIIGTSAIALLEFGSWVVLKIFTNQNIKNSKINDSFPERYSKAYLNEINYFYDMIKNNKESRILKEHILLNKKICKAINLSIEENRIVEIQ